jgi:hypothetical protein
MLVLCLHMVQVTTQHLHLRLHVRELRLLRQHGRRHLLRRRRHC